MKKGKVKNMLISIAVLCILAGASGLILGVINKVTYIDPQEASYRIYKKLAKTDENFVSKAQNQGNIILFAATKGENPYYGFTVSAVSKHGGKLEMYIIIKDNKIIKIDKGDHNETYFAKIENDEVEKGLTLYQKYYQADLNQTDSFDGGGYVLSGSTYTSDAIKSAVSDAVNYYKNYIKQGGGNGEA